MHSDSAHSEELRQQARRFLDAGKVHDAERLFREALALDEAGGERGAALADDLYEVARALFDHGRPNDAEPLYRRALEIDAASKGENHLDVARDLTDLAAVLRNRGGFAEAERLSRRALTIVRAQPVVSDSLVAMLLAAIAASLFNMEQPEEAYSLYRQAVALDKSFAGEGGTIAEPPTARGMKRATTFVENLFHKAPSPDSFARLVMKSLVDSGDAPDIQYYPEGFSVRSSSGHYFLENVYTSYCQANRGTRAIVLQNWIQSLRERPDIPRRFEAAMLGLMPMLRPEFEVSTIRISASDPTYVTRPFVDGVVLSLAYDWPTSLGLVANTYLETWGVGEDEVWQTAFRNLRLRSADSWKQVSEDVYASTWADSFDTTRIVFADLLNRVPVAGRRVVMIPSRNDLLVTGDRNEAAISDMLDRGLSLYDAEPYFLSPEPLVLTEGQWRPLALNRKVQIEVDRRRLKNMAVTYDEQKRLLESALEEDVFVASFFVAELTDPLEVQSLSSWGKGVTTLLPRTDQVWFVDGGDVVLKVLWDVVERVIGPWRAEPFMHPPRYRVNFFPDEETLQKLRLAASAQRPPRAFTD